MTKRSKDLRRALFPSLHLAATYGLIFAALAALFFGAGCSTVQLGGDSANSNSPDPDQLAFGRTNLLTGPIALEKALRAHDSAYDLDKSRFRIEMSRHYWGWWIEFIRLPESPDLVSVVRVYDDGRVMRGVLQIEGPTR